MPAAWITRPTGYAVLRRYAEHGEAGLEERSRAPRWHPNQTAVEIEEQVLKLRRNTCVGVRAR